MGLYLISKDVTQPTLTVLTGSLTVVVGGTDGDPIGILIPRVAGGAGTMVAGPNDTASFTVTGIPVGSGYSGVCAPTGAGRSDSAPFTFDITVAVPGCTDPDADNYNPAATDDNGSCTFSPRLTVVELPELAPIGVPLLVTLTGVAVPNAVPAPATALLNLSALNAVAGVQVRVDGYLFTSGPLIVPGRFTDAASLLDALRAQPALAAAYAMSLPGGEAVLLTSKVPGLPGTPTVSTSNAALLGVSTTAGAAQLWSQRRYNWGCYLEVWAQCGTVFGGVVDKSTAVLAQRLELDYRADNTYQFDIAPALSQFTGHAYPLADGSCPDRLVSYFVRFGEAYARTPAAPRQPRNAYESVVAWGLEAMVMPTLLGGLSPRYLLSARPGPWRVQAGDKVPACLLAKPDAQARTLLRYRLATSRAITEVLLGHEVATGAVTQANDKLLAPVGALSGELQGSDALSTAGPVLATLQFDASGQALTFVNLEGGCDTQYFEGTPDETSKRTAGTFTNSGGAQLLTAEASLPTRLTTKLLDYATWAWLRRELTTSPAAWLETAGGPVAVRLTDVSCEGDELKGEYSVSVDYETAPVRGLSN